MNHFLKTLTLGASFVAISFASQAAEYRQEITEIVKAFDTPDPEARYATRLRLAGVVADATAPDQVRGAEKMTDDLLYGLNLKGSTRVAKVALLRELARVGTPKAVSQLSRLLQDKDDLLAENARKALEAMPGEEASAALRKGYTRANAAGKKDLILAFGRRSDADAQSLVAQALRSGGAELQAAAAWALGRIGGEQATASLASAYDAASDRTVRQAIERALLAQKDTDGKTLQAIFERSGDVAIQRGALRELVKRRDPAVVETLHSALSSDNEDLRVVAIETALSSGVRSYAEIAASRSGELAARELGALLIGVNALERRVAEDIALQAYQSGDEGIQALALDALATCGSDRAVDTLLEAFGSKNKELSGKAASALAQLKSGELDFRLARMLRSSEPSEALLAVEALAVRSIPGGKVALLRLVEKGDQSIARAALVTLSTTADEADLKRLLAIAKGKDGESRRLIVALLKKLAPAIGSERLQAQVEAL